MTLQIASDILTVMTYTFKKFEGINTRFEDRITITKSNGIGFPTKFYNDNKIKNFKYVVLFWDEEKQAIGIHFTNDELEKNKFSIIHTENYGGNIVARSFFKSFGINPLLVYGRYGWTKHLVEEVREVFVIELTQKEPKKEI